MEADGVSQANCRLRNQLSKENVERKTECIDTDSSKGEEGTHLRQTKEFSYSWSAKDWDKSMPYEEKLYLPKKKRLQSLSCNILQVFAITFALTLLYVGCFHTKTVHLHVTKFFARMGHKEAQAIIGHRFLYGKGVSKNHTEAMIWLQEAAKQGHPHAAYNVAIGHLRGMKTDLKRGEARKMIEHAAANGVVEASNAVNKLCSKGRCDD